MKKPTPLIAAIAVALTMAGCAGAPGSSSSAASEGTSAAAAEVSLDPATSCDGTDSGDATATSTSDEATAVSAENSESHAQAADDEWEEGDVVTIALGDSVAVDSSAVTVSDSTVTITGAGTYELSGTLIDGRVVVDAGDDDLVQLILNGVDITNADGAAIAVMNARTAVVIAADGSTNTLTDGSTYVLADGEDEPNATLYSTADLTITGEGALTVNGNYNDGIGAKDGLVVESGNLMVNAVDDGIRGKDYIIVGGGAITVVSGGDGLKSDNDEDATKGYVEIVAGTLSITSGGDGIAAETDVLVSDGVFNITTGDGSSGNVGEDSIKGIKGLVSVVIDGGTFTIDAADDAVHSNDAIVVNGGAVTIATGDDGMHADTSLEVNNATILITASYEGLESALVTINSGDIEIHADDDGINVAGGQDGSGLAQGPGRGGGGDAFAVNSDYQLVITGGTIVIYSGGDGLDSNGTAEMSDGATVVHGPTANNNGAIDAGSFDVTGGLLIAVGSAGMARASHPRQARLPSRRSSTAPVPGGPWSTSRATEASPCSPSSRRRTSHRSCFRHRTW